MRRLLITAPGVVELVDAPLPSPKPGELRVRTRLVGICGSDLHALAGDHPFIDLPCAPGHEAVGIVDELGEGTGGPAVGTRVLLEPNLVCGRCTYCRSGRYNLCDNLVVVGCQTPGAMAEAFVAPANRFHIVPDALSDAGAALVEPLSTGVHAVRIAGDLNGHSVAVLGVGSIGLLTLIVAREAGASVIAVSEPRGSKRDRAGRLGAQLCVDPTAGDPVAAIRRAFGGRADVVFDCVASQSSITQAITLAEKGGSVVVVGVASLDVTIPLSIVQDREIRIEGSAMYVASDVEQAIRLISADAVPVDELVTATLPLAEGHRAFELAAAGNEVKVQLRAV